MPKKILVTGATGQLGREIQQLAEQYPDYGFLFATRETLAITDRAAIEHYCRCHDVAVIINGAAYTAVDKAETDRAAADAVNHGFVKNLAEVAAANRIALIHISTDYVFNGRNYQPYRETDAIDPQGVYGHTKAAGERALQAVNPVNSIIIRTSWLYSTHGNNFVKTMLRLGKEREALNIIYDQVGTPTYAKDLAQAILDIVPQLAHETVEVYHYSNEGVASWYDFAKAIFDHEKLSCQVNPIETKDYPTPAIRPHYSLLNKTKIKQEFCLHIPYWKDSLAVCLNSL